MRIFGLTGGICCGKSEAARRFEARGVPCIDADQVGHALIAPGGDAEAAVRDAFGSDIATAGRIDRKKLGALVFSDPHARQRLNNIVHPLVARAISEQCMALVQRGHRAIVVDAALLAERGFREIWLDGLILVLCSEEVRLRRLVALRGLSPEEARRRIQSQGPPEQKIPLAGWIIENEGRIEDFRARADAVAGEVLASLDLQVVPRA